MRKLLLAACLLGISVSVFASCDDLKSQIDAKLQAKGVTAYSLEIVPVAQPAAAPAAASGAAATPAKDTTGKVVGTCEGDTKQIIYKRN
ncbi:DUF1161 domain-containing protein [Sideroxydans sp. CL21]|jgi:hypothetical protein|uniref:DUF1161 domain-containing protein n=1 Tax=Sideroxydans sp. CL21 TaxID=2600596 RepID=UPI0024BCC2F1|nr:DUF1161 domain-containing protein [Sideroxydans sp. CL21]